MNTFPQKKITGLMAAVAQRKYGMFHALFTDVKDPDNLPEFKNQTLLHFAIGQKDLYIIEQVLGRGADPNRLTLHGQTALDLVLSERSGLWPDMKLALLARHAKRACDLSGPETYRVLLETYNRLLQRDDWEDVILKRHLENHPQGIAGFFIDYTMHHGKSPSDAANETGNTALSDFWQKIVDAPALLNAMTCPAPIGESPAPNHICTPDAPWDTYLYRQCRFGNLDWLPEKAPLTAGPFLTPIPRKDGQAIDTPLLYATQRGLLEKILQPRLWISNPNGLLEIVNHLPKEEIDKLKIDLQSIIETTFRRTQQQRHKPKLIIKR